LTISWAPAGPGSILSGTPQGGHKTQTLLAMLHPRLGTRGKGTRGAEVLAFSAPLSLSGLPPASSSSGQPRERRSRSQYPKTDNNCACRKKSRPVHRQGPAPAAGALGSPLLVSVQMPAHGHGKTPPKAIPSVSRLVPSANYSQRYSSLGRRRRAPSRPECVARR
jgi:hypothetical protein